jgi:hypothetical protein
LSQGLAGDGTNYWAAPLADAARPSRRGVFGSSSLPSFRRFAYILFFEAFVKPVELPVVRILLDLAVPFFEFFEVFLKFFERFFNLFPIEYQRFTWILENK